MRLRLLAVWLAGVALWLSGSALAATPAGALSATAPRCEEDSACLAQFDLVGQAAMRALARAAVHAIISAKTETHTSLTGQTGPIMSYCDMFATACKGPAGYPNAQGKTGRFNNITDVPGIEAGHHTRSDALTGTTVIYMPDGGTVGVEVRGSAPGTRESDLMKSVAAAPRVNAIALSGGSSYGLDSADGVVKYLQELGKGVAFDPAGGELVPIVPAAIIFDPGRYGAFNIHPTPDDGYKAAADHHVGPLAQGTVGSGAGAESGSVKGGFGTASEDLGGGLYVGAVIDINSAGSTFDSSGCFYAGDLQLDNEFGGLKPPAAGCATASGSGAAAAGSVGGASSSFDHRAGRNTTIGVVATNMPLDKTMAEKLAQLGEDGESRSTRQSHSMFDGDSVFGVSTGTFATSPATITLSLPNTAGGRSALLAIALLLFAVAIALTHLQFANSRRS